MTDTMDTETRSQSRHTAPTWSRTSSERTPLKQTWAAFPKADQCQRTRTVTIMFTDLVDSTALRSRVGDAVADDIRRAHDRLFSDAIQLHEGKVVKRLGDGLMSAYLSTTDAISAATAMQRAITRYNRDAIALEPVAIRVGVSTGDVSWEFSDYFGMPVVEAARLEAAARGGQILVTAIVQALAGSRGGFAFRSVGQLHLKGLPEAVAAAEVLWDDPSTHSAPGSSGSSC